MFSKHGSCSLSNVFRRGIGRPQLHRFHGANNVNVSPSISVNVETEGRGIELYDPEGRKHMIHSIWLRERTNNAEKIHAESRQRLFDVSDYVSSDGDIASGSRISDVSLTGSDLSVEYADGSSDCFDLKCILAELQDPNTLPTFISGKRGAFPMSLSTPKPHLWGSDLSGHFSIDMATHEHDEIVNSQGKMADFLNDLFRYGTALVKGTPTDRDVYERFLLKFGLLRDTNWGKWFQVMATSNKADSESDDGVSVADAAFTNLGIPFHTDGPYNRNPLQHQLLQCIKQSKQGGESQLSDGFAAARALQLHYPKQFDILTKTKLRFRYYDDNVDMFTVRPMIVTDDGGAINSVYYSGRVDASPSFENIEKATEFYYAKKLFTEHINEATRQISFKLEENDMLIFDNCRVLHGRSAFQDVEKEKQTASNPVESPSEKDHTTNNQVVDGVKLDSVSRFLRGCYMDSIDIRLRKYNRVLSATSRSYSTTTARVGFVQLDECTENDMEIISDLYSTATTGEKLAERSLALLKMLGSGSIDNPCHVDDGHLGANVDLLEHGLQTATRAFRDGQEDEVVVAALLHDIGELLSPSNHGEFAARYMFL